jgi:hypothetical protein
MSKSANQALIPSLDQHQMLDYSKGAGALTSWSVKMEHVLIGVGIHGDEFLTGVSQAPVVPHEDDLHKSRKSNPNPNPDPKPDPNPNPDGTVTRRAAATGTETAAPAPATAAARATTARRKYELDPQGEELSTKGQDDFIAAENRYKDEKKVYDAGARLAFTVILSNFQPSTMTALHTESGYAAIRAPPPPRPLQETHSRPLPGSPTRHHQPQPRVHDSD